VEWRQWVRNLGETEICGKEIGGGGCVGGSWIVNPVCWYVFIAKIAKESRKRLDPPGEI